MIDSIEVLGKLKLERFILTLLYDMDTPEEIAEGYEEKIKNSFEEFTVKLGNLYEEVDKEDNRLFDIVSDFAEIHDDVYFEVGVLTGIKLVKSLESVYIKSKKLSLKEFEDRNISLGNGSGESVLHKFAQIRMGTALEEALRKDEEFQRSSQKTRETINEMQENGITSEQWKVIDEALSENNKKAAEYGKMAYQQGILDLFCFLKELSLQT